MKLSKYLTLIGICAAAVSCSNNGSQWHIKGTISGLEENQAVILEGNNQGYWYVIDTLKVDSKNGTFKYSGERHGYPDIFRMRLGENAMYFPIDSLETLTITATAPDIAGNHTVSGTPQAENMAKVDSLIMASASRNGIAGIAGDETLKRQLADIILADPAGVVSYYAISKSVGNQPLYNPTVSIDHRIIGAVANAFNTQRPDDPRTKYLKTLYLNNRRVNPSSPGATMQAEVINAFEIDLYDNEGKRHSLTELTQSGHPVLLNFTAYGAEWSTPFNVALNKVYDKYHPMGLEIYQVAFDNDEYTWKQIARNLPWITVYNNLADGDRVLRQYNVTELPTLFLFNRQGELVQRITSIDGIESAVARVM